MLSNVRVIDADGHLMDFDDLVRPYLPEPFRRRVMPLYPLENWDRDLGGTLGKHWLRDVPPRLAYMDVQGIDLSVLYPTLGLFIGRHGQTIEAVQHLAQRIAFRGQPSDVRVVIDAAGYRDRRASALRREADEAAEGALSGGRPVALDAMTASERRLIHEYLRERGDVETYSEGNEPDRHLVVAPLEGS